MNAADYINTIGTILLPIALAVWTWRQWKSDRDRSERQRDDHLTQWAMKVIDAMAHLDAFARSKSPDIPVQRTAAMDLITRLSALVDQGRLFFPNVDTPKSVRGNRPKLLDEVLRANYIAEALLSERNSADIAILRRQLRAARRAFIKLMQEKTRRSLYPAVVPDTGVVVSKDPLSWPDRRSSRQA